jgi:predicted alpha/beta hydrolase
MDNSLEQSSWIMARDGFRLAATLFLPSGPPRRAVMVSSATAVPRRIYRSFAAYLAQNGFLALTYDYRGIGESRPRSLRGFHARMRDWATLDVAGIVDHVRRQWPHLSLCSVGHSFGGQAIGLIPNNQEIDRALLVASQSGYWRFYKSRLEQLRVWTMFRIVVPPVAHTIGYVPGSKLGVGEDLPNGVFFEWSRWCMQPDFFFDDPTLEETANFSRFKGPLRAIGIDDDPWATPCAIDALTTHFTGTAPERQQIAPKSVGVDRIGHFGYFRPQHRETLWPAAAHWLGANDVG